MSSRSTQIAQQNRSAEEPEGVRGRVSTRPAFEHTIWQSEVRRKGAAGGSEEDTQCFRAPPTCLYLLTNFPHSLETTNYEFSNNRNSFQLQIYLVGSTNVGRKAQDDRSYSATIQGVGTRVSSPA